MAGPLRGIRVLDLSRVLAGPWCTQIFADLGAEVIKIERPGKGDDTRHWGPPWLSDASGADTRESSYFLAANRGKHSVTVDLGKQEGVDIVRALAGKSDVVVENFKTGDLARKGLGYEDLSELNPGLVYCSITGFGQTGPMAHLPGYDYLIQAQGGLMSLTGIPDGEPGAGPQRVGLAVSDLTTGMNAAIAILAALRHRDHTGRGQHIDLSLLDVQVSWLANQAQNYFCSGEAPGRTGEYHSNLAPYQPFPTKDGSLIIAVGNDDQFRRLCIVLGMPDLADDPRFATNPARVTNREAMAAQLVTVTVRRSSSEWTELLQAEKVPCGPILSVDQVFDDPQVQSRNMLATLEHPSLGPVQTVANPIKYSETPIEYAKAPPCLGEDTDTVLQQVLGISPDEIIRMRNARVL
jgi:crotonobetainyl-CoA:carnitine CoA-transferase CaiB-like acyl-CoA transferase